MHCRHRIEERCGHALVPSVPKTKVKSFFRLLFSSGTGRCAIGRRTYDGSRCDGTVVISVAPVQLVAVSGVPFRPFRRTGSVSNFSGKDDKVSF